MRLKAAEKEEIKLITLGVMQVLVFEVLPGFILYYYLTIAHLERCFINMTDVNS